MAGGKDSKEGRQTVFFTAVDPTNEPRILRRERASRGTLPNEVEILPECSMLDHPQKHPRQD